MLYPRKIILLLLICLSAQGQESSSEFSPSFSLMALFLHSMISAPSRSIYNNYCFLPDTATGFIQHGAGPSRDKKKKKTSDSQSKKKQNTITVNAGSDEEYDSYKTRMTGILERIEQVLKDFPNAHLVLVIDPASSFYDFDLEDHSEFSRFDFHRVRKLQQYWTSSFCTLIPKVRDQMTLVYNSTLPSTAFSYHSDSLVTTDCSGTNPQAFTQYLRINMQVGLFTEIEIPTPDLLITDTGSKISLPNTASNLRLKNFNKTILSWLREDYSKLEREFFGNRTLYSLIRFRESRVTPFQKFQAELVTQDFFQPIAELYFSQFCCLYQGKKQREDGKESVTFDIHNLTVNKHVALEVGLSFIKERLNPVISGKKVVMVVIGNRLEDLPIIRPDKGILSFTNPSENILATRQQRLRAISLDEKNITTDWWVLSIVPEKQTFIDYNVHAAASVSHPKVVEARGRGLLNALEKLYEIITQTAFFTSPIQ